MPITDGLQDFSWVLSKMSIERNPTGFDLRAWHGLSGSSSKKFAQQLFVAFCRQHVSSVP